MRLSAYPRIRASARVFESSSGCRAGREAQYGVYSPFSSACCAAWRPIHTRSVSAHDSLIRANHALQRVTHTLSSIYDCPRPYSSRIPTVHRARIVAVRRLRCWRGECNPLCKSLLTRAFAVGESVRWRGGTSFASVYPRHSAKRARSSARSRGSHVRRGVRDRGTPNQSAWSSGVVFVCRLNRERPQTYKFLPTMVFRVARSLETQKAPHEDTHPRE